ncbi:MAG: aromatic amino acid ammonia-lyase [Lachnospiraceae bacterium]|nr:aromatic amino acid ammonia-lyase [Lachnospiraceae bacterium]MDD3615417.1 aromatic amino acid ammonia-lyase [Lachnospiraceae bacterium]
MVQETIYLGAELSLETFMKIVRGHAKVEFLPEYTARVKKSRAVVERFVEENRAVYGLTTGFGALVSQRIDKSQAELLQKNIVLTHSVSVGEPFEEEVVRAIILMVLQSLGRGVSGVRMELLELYRQFLNRGLVPYTPKEGSVGYLCAEGHIAAAAIGEGKAYVEGNLYDAKTALSMVGLSPIVLSYKEGLALLNGTTSATALAAIGIYDLQQLSKTADIVAGLSLESLGGLLKAYDDRILDCRPQKEMYETAHNIQKLLADSQVIESFKDTHIQDALSLRCIPQLHGAVKRVLNDAADVIQTEINSCGDNPIIAGEPGFEEALSNGNPDASYVGIEMDAACVAAVNLAKMSERRNARFLDSNLSDMPWFLVKKPGLNSGLMIPQYTQAGLLNELRGLATASTIDSVSTSAGQEDYVSMGYNACCKSLTVVKKAEYILAIELMSAYQSQQFIDKNLQRGKGSRAVWKLVGSEVPVMEEDMYLYPYLEKLKTLIHQGALIQAVEEEMGILEN